jgi:hypothetical protein
MDRGDIVTMLESEARRRPEIAALLARCETLTDEDIDNAQVPLKWYRDALREARQRKTTQLAYEAIEKLAKLQTVSEVTTSENEKLGVWIEYTGDNFWAKGRRGFEIEIKAGDWLFFPEDGSGAWLNQTFLDRPAAQLKQSRKVGEGTRYEYLCAYQNNLLSLPVSGATVVDGVAAEPAQVGGFRYASVPNGVRIG